MLTLRQFSMGLCQVLLSNKDIFRLESIHASGDKKHEKRRFLLLLFRGISLKN